MTNFADLHNSELVRNKYTNIITGALDRLIKNKEIKITQIRLIKQ
jgi:hypothetical protein